MTVPLIWTPAQYARGPVTCWGIFNGDEILGERLLQVLDQAVIIHLELVCFDLFSLFMFNIIIQIKLYHAIYHMKKLHLQYSNLS